MAKAQEVVVIKEPAVVAFGGKMLVLLRLTFLMSCIRYHPALQDAR